MLFSLAILLATFSICPGVPSKAHASDWVTSEDYCRLKEAHISVQQRADIVRIASEEDEESRGNESDQLKVAAAHFGGGTATQVVVWEFDSSQNNGILVFTLRGDHAVLILSGAESHEGYFRHLNIAHHGMHDFVTSGFSGGAGEYQNF